MKYIHMPRTDLRPSAICLGSITWEEHSPLVACYDEYVEWGGNCFDTANLYGKHETGTNAHERLLGRWLKSKPPSFRDNIYIMTKGGHPPLGDYGAHRLSKGDIAADLEESLAALGIEAADLYWLHRDDPGRPVGEILGYLNEFAAQGKIRYFGVSNWTAARMREAESYAQSAGLRGFVANQPQWSCAQANQEALDEATCVSLDEDAFRFHKETGLTVMPYSPNARGYFQKLIGGVPLRGSVKDNFDSPENRRRLEILGAVAAERGCTVTQASLAYLLQQPFPTIPIVGGSSREQLRESIDAVDVALDSETIAMLRAW